MSEPRNPFAPATKRAAKARIALDGPAGSGKTWTSLEWATVLADGGRIAFVDTERGSASLYAGHFDFDVIEVQPPFDPRRLVELIRLAEANAYPVMVIDSLTHFWNGEGGTLDIVDQFAGRSRSGNTFTAWKEGTPIQRSMVDTILNADMHVIATMRSKQEYILETDERGKQTPRRVGMAPEQRAGVEFEFTLVGDIDLSHTMVFSKSRCDLLSDLVVKAGETRGVAETFRKWLTDGEPLATRTDVDALIQAMSKLPSSVRAGVKHEFVAAFGDPKALPASKLVDARQFVADAEQLAASAEEAEQAADDGKSMRRLFACLNELGIGDDQRHAWATKHLGRDVASFTELDDDDVHRLIDVALDQRQVTA